MGVREVLEIVKEAYQQEVFSMNKLDTKADNATKYISIYLVLVNLLITVLFKMQDLIQNAPRLSKLDYILILLPATITLIAAIFGQLITKMSFLPNGQTLIAVIEEYKTLFKTEEDYLQYRIDAYDKMIATLRKTNKFKRICVFIAYGGYFLSLAIFLCVMIVKFYT